MLGNYDLRHIGEIGKSAPAITMAARHADHIESITPAPNAYNLTQPRGNGITMSAKLEQKINDSGVSPGQYNVNVPLDGPKYSMGSRHDVKHENLTPSPGAYSIPSTIGQAPAITISGRHLIKEDNSNPASNQYDVNISSVKSSAPAYSMRPKTAIERKVEGPAPTAYNIASTIGNAPAASISGRHELKVESLAPGPGWNFIFTKIIIFIFIFTVSHLLMSPRGILTELKFFLLFVLFLLGNYDVLRINEIGKSAPAHTMAARHADHVDSATPAPNAYNLAQPRGNGITMSGRLEQKINDSGVSPGKN
jgi:hypothetical protein